MNQPQAVVLLSGGQDSTTCLYWALEKYGKSNVRGVGFDYGQRHARELDCAKDICRRENIPFEVLDMHLLSWLGENALTNLEMTVDCGAYEGAYPNTFVPGRNHLFLSVAAIYARKWGIRDIITGVGQADFSGYPDCRDTFVKALNVALNLAMDDSFNLITPLMWLSKAEIWELAARLGCLSVVKEKTLTCYNGIVGCGCGHCPACILRKKGYEEYWASTHTAP